MYCKKLVMTLLCILLISGLDTPKVSYSQSNKNYNIAVLDLQAIGIPETEAKALSEMLRSGISQVINESDTTKVVYKLVERSQMDKIFDEFKIQSTGCTDVSCAIEFGKMLSVERIVIGSVSLVGETYIVIVRIVDVETSTIIRSVNRTHAGKIDGVIDILPLVAKELLTGIRPSDTLAVRSTQEAVKDEKINKPDIFPQTEVLGIKLVTIPSGGFDMGSENGDKDEQPVNKIFLLSFQIGVSEITQKQYRDITGINPSHFTDDNLPVENVNWSDAARFCNMASVKAGLESCYNEKTWECDFTKNGFRLPTEAEWEYSCRAGSKTIYYTGDTVVNLAETGWFNGNSVNKTHGAGTKAANMFGLYDMLGNVSEWCNDWYDENYYQKNQTSNPSGAKTGHYRVIRGGSWNNDFDACRSTNRSLFAPSLRYNDIGFRIVRRASP